MIVALFFNVQQFENILFLDYKQGRNTLFSMEIITMRNLHLMKVGKGGRNIKISQAVYRKKSVEELILVSAMDRDLYNNKHEY